MRISASCTAVLAYVATSHPSPAVAQVDQQRARQFFEEARALCERDGGRIAFDAMRAACAESGRDPSEVELSAGGFGRTPDEMIQRIEQLESIGVRRVMLPALPGEKLDAMVESLRDRVEFEQ